MKRNCIFNILIALFGIALFLSGASLYFQFVMNFEPCPLCIAQRIAIFGLTLVYFWFFFKNTMHLIINSCLQLFFALFGAGMAARQLWLIHLPIAEKTGCMPYLSIFWNYLPFWKIIKVFFNGTGDCIEHPWAQLDITMPEWTLDFFIFFDFMAIVNFTIVLRR